MKKNNVWGLLSLLLFAVVLSFLVSALGHSLGSNGHPEPDGVLRTAGLILFGLAAASIFFASKGRRLRMALMLAVGSGAGFLLNYLRLSIEKRLFAIFAVLLLYFLGCILYNSYRFRQAIRPLNEATLAYRQDHDGEKFLEALDRCAPALPKGGLVKKPGIGTITFQEHLDCERIEVLGSMGRLKERRVLIEQLRRETKSPGLPAWLDEKEAECSIDETRES